jgi:hypothetical protein
MTALILDFTDQVSSAKWSRLWAGLNEDQSHVLSCEAETHRFHKDGGSMECHFVEKSPGRFEEFLYSGILTAIGGQGDYDDIRSLEMKERNKRNISQYLNISLYGMD